MHQTDLAHNTKCLHQQTTDALHNIAKLSALQENVHFMNDVSILKAKHPSPLMNDWIKSTKLQP